MSTKYFELTKIIAEAILKGEKHFKGIILPSSQKTGSYMQQRTYAYIKAQEIIKVLSG